MVYIRQALWPKVEEKVKRYQRWRSIRARLVKVNSEILLIVDKMEKAITVKAQKERKR